MMKYNIMKYLAALALISATPTLAAEHFPAFEGQPVIDAANVIPDQEEQRLDQKLTLFKKSTNNEFAIVTVPSLEGYPIEQYSIDLAQHLGVGRKDINSGVMLLVAPNEHKVRIEVGYGLESYFTDIESGRIINDVIVPDFKAGDLPKGIEDGADAIIKAATPLTPEQLEQQAAIKRAEQERAAVFKAGAEDIFLTLLTLLGLGGLSWGSWRIITAPKRRRLKAEREAHEKAERKRREELYAQAEAARIERERKRQEEQKRRIAEEKAAREAMLAAMTPAKRRAFLKKEEADKIAAEKKAREEAEARRKRDEESSSSYSSYSSLSSDYSSSSSSSDFGSFGGGGFGGGGASGSW